MSHELDDQLKREVERGLQTVEPREVPPVPPHEGTRRDDLAARATVPSRTAFSPRPNAAAAPRELLARAGGLARRRTGRGDHPNGMMRRPGRPLTIGARAT
jgi:hypothetical protein